MFSKAFWKATAQRVVRSFAASLGALLTADGTGILDASWSEQLSAAGMAAVITLLLCLAGEQLTDGAGPAFGTTEITSPPAPPLGDEPVAPAHRDETGVVNWLAVIAVAVLFIAAVVLFSLIDVNKDKDNDGRHGLDWERSPIGVRA